MVLLRHLLGDVLRRLRQRQGRTLREVSASARVSLGYLSEVERGQKEASSELLAAICTALNTPLSHVLGEVSDSFALAELQNEAELQSEPVLASAGASRSGQSPVGQSAAVQSAAARSAAVQSPMGRPRWSARSANCSFRSGGRSPARSGSGSRPGMPGGWTPSRSSPRSASTRITPPSTRSPGGYAIWATWFRCKSGVFASWTSARGICPRRSTPPGAVLVSPGCQVGRASGRRGVRWPGRRAQDRQAQARGSSVSSTIRSGSRPVAMCSSVTSSRMARSLARSAIQTLCSGSATPM